MIIFTRTDFVAFVAGFALAWLLLRQRQTPPDRNTKPQTPSADFEHFDKRTPTLPQTKQKGVA